MHNPLSGGRKVNLNSTFLVIFPMSPSKYGWKMNQPIKRAIDKILPHPKKDPLVCYVKNWKMNNRSKAPPHATKYWPFKRKTDEYTILNTCQKLTLGPQKLTWGLILQRKGGGGSAGALATCNQQQQQLHALTDTWISWWLIHALICSFFSRKTMGNGGISSRS